MAKEKPIKKWIPAAAWRNITLKQNRIQMDLGVKVPKGRILLALTRQPLIPDQAGLNIEKFRRKKKR